MDKIQKGVILILVCFQINTKAELTGKPLDELPCFDNRYLLCVQEVVTQVTYFIKWVTTSWTYTILEFGTPQIHCKC